MAGSLSIGSTLLTIPNKSNAACLPGDTSASCIGVYKIPLDTATTSPLLNTPQALKLNAPDVKYVRPIEPPKSVLEAVEILQAQRLAAKDIEQVIWAGRLEEAGIKVLNLVPRVTMAGNHLLDYVRRVYQDDTPINQIRLLKSDRQLSEMVVSWSELDVEIGQALRGYMGVSAVAQLYLLQSLQEAIVSMDEFIFFMESSSGIKK